MKAAALIYRLTRWRRTAVFLLSAWLCLIPAARPQTGDNLVINGSFEEFLVDSSQNIPWYLFPCWMRDTAGLFGVSHAFPIACFNSKYFSDFCLKGWYNCCSFSIDWPDLYSVLCPRGWHFEDLQPCNWWASAGAYHNFQDCTMLDYYQFKNKYGFQYPRSGLFYAGLQIWGDSYMNFSHPSDPKAHNLREYLQGRLREPMKVGQAYCVEVYVNRHDMYNYTPGRLSFYFHDLDTPYYNNTKSSNSGFNYNHLEPQLHLDIGHLTDTASWYRAEGVYIARGGEKWFIFGNFQDDDEMEWVKFQENYDDKGGSDKMTIVLVDDFAIYECDHIQQAEAETVVPNVITPNGDGLNDVLYINGLAPGSRLWIYNRWGTLLYYSPHYQNDWPRPGEAPANGTYYYILQLPLGTVLKGFLTVIH